MVNLNSVFFQISFASTVPEKFFAINRSTILSPKDPDVKEVVIGARSVYNHYEVITEVGKSLRVEHRVENGSIVVVLMYRKLDPDEE